MDTCTILHDWLRMARRMCARIIDAYTNTEREPRTQLMVECCLHHTSHTWNVTQYIHIHVIMWSYYTTTHVHVQVYHSLKQVVHHTCVILCRYCISALAVIQNCIVRTSHTHYLLLRNLQQIHVHVHIIRVHYMSICTYTYIYMNTCLCTWTHVYVQEYMYMYIWYTWLYMYMYISRTSVHLQYSVHTTYN